MITPSRREGRQLRKHRDNLQKKVGPKTKYKRVYRVRAHTDDSKAQLLFWKTRTKKPTSTIRRFASLHGFIPDRITT